MKSLIKSMLRLTPYRLSRAGAGNRFQAIEDNLNNMAARGFKPDHIIDGGANVGQFAGLARRIWPSALIHMIEPQQSCRPALDKIAKMQGFSIHSVALGDREGVLQLASDPASTSTGAHVVEDMANYTSGTIEVPVRTLDQLFSDKIKRGQSCFLKLDLQGYELHALRGATQLLGQIDVILVEVSFYAQAYEPPISELILFFEKCGFDLHDIAALTGRRRDGRAHQADFVFVKKDSLLARDTAWS